jgi:hypothetical protein
MAGDRRLECRTDAVKLIVQAFFCIRFHVARADRLYMFLNGSPVSYETRMGLIVWAERAIAEFPIDLVK